MRTEENKALIRLVFEKALNRGHLAIVDEVFSSHFVDHSTPGQVAGPEGVKAYFEQVLRGFPDIHVTIEDMIAESDKVAVRTTWQGTHSGIYEGVESTGKLAKRTLVQIFRLSDGKIQEEWNEGEGLLT